jgi:hypothetical protein
LYYNSDPSLAPYLASTTSTPVATTSEFPPPTDLNDAVQTYPSTAPFGMQYPDASPPFDLLGILAQDPTLTFAHNLDPLWITQSSFNSPDGMGMSLMMPSAWGIPSTAPPMPTMTGNGGGGLSLQESLTRINVTHGGEMSDGTSSAHQMAMGWDGQLLKRMPTDQDALWRSMMNTSGNDGVGNHHLAAPAPAPTTTQTGPLSGPPSNHGTGTGAGMAIAMARAAEAAAAPLPQGIGEAANQGMKGRPLEAINEAKNLISDLVSIRSFVLPVVRVPKNAPPHTPRAPTHRAPTSNSHNMPPRTLRNSSNPA